MAPLTLRAPAALLFAFALFAFSPLAFAASVNDTARLYVADGELSAMDVVPFSASGSQYYMVTVAGKEALLLAPSGADFQPVSDNATLLAVLPAYISSAYSGVFSETNLDSLKAHFEELNATFDYCAQPMKGFLNGGTLLWWILQTDDRGSSIPKSFLAVSRLGGNATIGIGSQASLKNGIDNASEKISALSADVSPDEIRNSLAEVYETVWSIKGLADEYSADFNFLESRHPDSFHKRTCALSSSSFDNVTDDLHLKDVIPSSAGLSSALAASTPVRAEYRKVKEISAAESKKLADLRALYNSTQKVFAGTGLNLTGLSRGIDSLSSKLASLEAATDLSTARPLQADFDKAYNSTYGWLYEFTSSSLAKDIVASVNATNDAKNATAGAALRLGENNDDVIKVKQKVKVLEANLDSNLSVVQNANGSVVSAAVFQNLTVAAQALSQEADGLKPAWQQNDLVIVAFFVIILAAVFGIVVWYRNQKAIAEVSAKISERGNREMEERDR